MITYSTILKKTTPLRVVFFRLSIFGAVGLSLLTGLLLTACGSKQLTLTGAEVLRFHPPADFYPRAACLLGYYDDSLRGREHFYFLDRTRNTLLHTEVSTTRASAGVLEMQKISLLHLFNRSTAPIEAMGVFSPDSLLFVDGAAHNLCLTNAQGNIRQQWQPRAPIYGRTPYFIDTGLHPIYTHGSRVYLHCGPDDGGTIIADTAAFHRFLTYPAGLVLNVRDTTWANNKTGQFPAFLSAKNNFNVVSPQTCVSPKGNYLFTYGPFSEIYRYSLAGGKQVINAPSRYHRPARGLPFAALQDHQALINYKLTEPEYGPILSDPYRHRYLRVYRHGMPEARNQPMRPSYADMPWSLMLLDEDLKVVGEVKFAPTFDPRLVLVTRRGVLIGNRRPEHPGYDPQQLSFQLFTYQTSKEPSS